MDGGLAVNGTVADRGKPSSPEGQCAIVLMWFLWYFVLQKPNHISTDCYLQTWKLQMHRSPTVLHYVFLTNVITSNKSIVHLLDRGSYTLLGIFSFSSRSNVSYYTEHFFFFTHITPSIITFSNFVCTIVAECRILPQNVSADVQDMLLHATFLIYLFIYLCVLYLCWKQTCKQTNHIKLLQQNIDMIQ